MSWFIVRNGSESNPRLGVDWRAVAALGGLLLAVGAVAIGLLQERIVVLAHVAKGEAMILPVQHHIDNIGPYKHLDLDQFREFVAMQWQIEEIRKDILAIKRHLRVKDETIRIGADYVPPGRDD